MPLRKVKPGSQMYQFLNDWPLEGANRGFTWNVIKGRCPDNDCKYCFMKVFQLSPRHFDSSELKASLGEGNFIFVGSSNDVFSATVPADWIKRILEVCRAFPENRYLFQSKNPKRFSGLINEFPEASIFGTTIETNRNFGEYLVSKAPPPYERAHEMDFLSKYGYKVMITIEPLMDFDLEVLVGWMNNIQPEWINIGADSKGHHLPEPNDAKITQLVLKLHQNHKIILKSNLRRISDVSIQ